MTSAPEPKKPRRETLDSPPDPLLGLQIQSFVVKQRLTEGGMGVVYLAEHMRLPIQRVIKLLLPEYARVPAIQQRFLREAEAAARLQHDNIIKIEDYGTLPDGQCYLAMDYLHGETLDDFLRRHGTLDPHRACLLVAQIGSALQHAHEHGIVHRDLKPGNVFLERVRSGIRVVLLDFGIAKDTRARDAFATDTGMVLGTPAYMAVEQFEDASRVSPAADIYALAIIAWQMLTGELPWGMHSAPVLYRKQMSERPPAPPEAVMSRQLARVLYAALAVDPVARPPSMRAFAVAFASAIPAIPPDHPSGAEILAAVAPDLVIEAPHHEMTLRNLAAQDRIGALLWPHLDMGRPGRRDEAASSGVPHEVPGPTSPTPSDRVVPAPAVPDAPIASSSGQQGPAVAPAAFEPAPRLADHRPSPRWLVLLAIGVVLVASFASFSLARLVAGRDAAGAGSQAAVQAGPAAPVSPDPEAIVARVPVDAAAPQSLVLDATPALSSALDGAAASGPVVSPSPDAPLAALTSRPASPPPSAGEPSVRLGQAGLIIVRSSPWSRVWIDGESLGQTAVRHSVKPGTHRIRLVGPDDKTRDFTREVKPGATVIIRWDW